MPWKRALKEVEYGRFDMVLGAFDTEERRRHFFYTEQIYSVDEYVIGLTSVGISSFKNTLNKSSNSIYNLVSRRVSDSAQILTDFKLGMRTIKENGTYDAIIADSDFETKPFLNAANLDKLFSS